MQMKETRGTLYWLAFLGTALLFLLPPFFRGLFFPPEQQKALVWAVLVFGLLVWWKHERREYAFLTHPLDYMVLALPVVYVLSAFQAANLGLAVNEVVKNLLYFLVYWAVVQLVREEKDLSVFMHAVYIAAVGVALAGLATATGIINIPDGFVGGRIYSSFQYPNALASYLALAVFLGFFLWLKNSELTLGDTLGGLLPGWGQKFPRASAPGAGKGAGSREEAGRRSREDAGGRRGAKGAAKGAAGKSGAGKGAAGGRGSQPQSGSGRAGGASSAAGGKETAGFFAGAGQRLCLWGYFYAAGNFLLLLVLLGTKSRGGLLITTLVGVLYLAGLSWQRRPVLVFHLLAAGGAAAVVMDRFIAAAAAGQRAEAWGWVLLGLAAVLLLQAVYRFWLAGRLRFPAEMRSRVNAAILALGVLAAGAGVCWLAVHPAVLERVQSFSYLHSALARFFFVGDAVEMFKERPLLGWGGGGWKEAYRAYQDWLYNSTEVHSHYFQVAVETGILGLAAIIGIWLVFLWTGGRAYWAAAPQSWRRDWLWSLMAAAVAVGAHAAIDFDLSLSALTVALWAVFAMVRVMAGWPDPGSLEAAAAEVTAAGAYGGAALGLGRGIASQERLAAPEERRPAPENAPGTAQGATGRAPREESGGAGQKEAGKLSGKEQRKAQAKMPEKTRARTGLPAPNYSWLAGMLGLAAVLFVFAFSLMLASTYARTAYGFLSGEKADANAGVAYLQRAAACNPFEAEFHSTMADIYIQAGYGELAVQEAEAAAKRSRYSAAVKAELAFAYAMAGRYEEALGKGREAMAAAPYQQAWYEKAANVFVFAGFNKLRAGDAEAARSCFLEALQVPQRMEAVRAGVSEYGQRMWIGAPLEVTPRLALYVGQAEYFLSRWAEAEKDLLQAANSKEADKSTQGEAFLWLALVKDKAGRAEEAQAFLEKAKAVRAEYGEQFEQLKKVAVIKG